MTTLRIRHGMSETAKGDQTLWHRRLMHLNPNDVMKMYKKRDGGGDGNCSLEGQSLLDHLRSVPERQTNPFRNPEADADARY